MSIINDRKTFRYRMLEGAIGYTVITFLGILILLSFVNPILLSIFLILYSFFFILKVGLHYIYTIYTYQNLKRWEKVDVINILNLMEKDYVLARAELQQIKNKYIDKIDWSHKLNQDIKVLDTIENTKFASPKNIIQIPLFSVYDESSEVLTKSLKAIYESKYNLDKVIVFVSQEARAGDKFNRQTYEDISQLDWVNSYNDVSETDLQKVYPNEINNIKTETQTRSIHGDFKSIELSTTKLNVVFTQHPDGLVGEIKGKASNEDWGARQASLFVDTKGIDPELVVVTSLDSDSKIGPNFLQMLSLRFCLTEKRFQSGFQPVPIYSNNFFDANLFPRLVATNTTLWHMVQYSLGDELHFFANYSVPLIVLRKIDYWVREVIAEDNLLFAKCLVKFNGDFQVVPVFSYFEGDAVEGEDYLETLLNQYKQLQRWAWGGIEGFPYKFKHFFWEKEGSKIDIRIRLRMVFSEFSNHFFWSTSPTVFGLIVFFPQVFATQEFRESQVQINLWLFSQYFSWVSFIFLACSGFLSFYYIGKKAFVSGKTKWYHWCLIIFQWMISPFIYLMWGPPAFDVQIRGILGKYLGYWVTPKK